MTSNINAGKHWWTNGVPVILPIQTLEMFNNADPSVSNSLQVYSVFQDGLIQRGTSTYCRINEFCAGTLDWSATNRPQFWLIDVSCAYIYAKMYETNFYDAVWSSKLGNDVWLGTHPVKPVTPSQFGQLMRDAKAAGQFP